MGYAHGPFTAFYKNGQTDARGPLKRNLAEGLWEFYNQKGRIQYAQDYNLGNKAHGLYFNNDGTLFAIQSWGEKEKTSTKWVFYRSGQLKFEWNYKLNQLEGLSREYHENGQIKTLRNYQNSFLHGLIKIFNEKGEPTKERYYELGGLIKSKTF